MTDKIWITGLVPAVFTPMRQDGSLALKVVPPMVDQLIKDGVSGLYVCGSTGEFVSLTSEERRQVAQAYVAAAAGRVPVIVQVGHNSLGEARALAAHAGEIGADAIAAVPPFYFKPNSPEAVIDCLAEVSAGAPDLPFYYYHIPGMTGVALDIPDFFQLARRRLPNLVGLKFSAYPVSEMQACLDLEGDRPNILFGADDMLFSGLVVGVPGAVGTTYNYAAPLFVRMIRAFESGDLAEAKSCQALAVKMVRAIRPFRQHAGHKAVMRLIGLDCGPVRLPLQNLQAEEIAELKRELERIGFFDWART
jgi:N-acetylneuraminate lyase